MKRILVAGVGNLFMGDDAFGVEVVRQLALRSLPDGITVIDSGIRGLDLAYALLDGYDLAILIDTTQRGGAPGTLYVLEPDTDHWHTDRPAADAHGMVPEQAIRFARMLGKKLPPLRVIACEPATFDAASDGTFRLSEAVQAAVEPAIELVRSLIAEVLHTAEVETTGQFHA